MSENLVRDIHDAAATSEYPAQASTRPPGTTRRELRAMRRDVLRKLRLAAGMSVVEVGCGVGLLGVPIAERAGRYVGLDFAPRAVEVVNERLRAAGVSERAHGVCMDVLGAEAEAVRELGSFDRVVMYAVLHCARDEREASLFLQRAVDLLAPGGMALIGNLPLDDLRVDWAASDTPPRGLLGRVRAVAGWVASAGVAPVPLTRRWKARRVLEATLKQRSPGDDFTPARLPPDYTLTLTTAAVERWLRAVGGEVTHHWELPAPGVPLAPARADLILVRR